jgi:hypothetical protein
VSISSIYAGFVSFGGVGVAVATAELREQRKAPEIDSRREARLPLVLFASALLLIAGSLLANVPHADGLALKVALGVPVVAIGVAMVMIYAPLPANRVSTRARRRLTWRSVVTVALAGAFGAGIALLVSHLVQGDSSDYSPLAKLKPHPMYVFGTCANNHCGLNRRTMPEATAPTVKSQLEDGDLVVVLCQRYGGRATARGNRESLLWDLLIDRTWVSDLFITSSKAGAVSGDLPRCPAHIVA